MYVVHIYICVCVFGILLKNGLSPGLIPDFSFSWIDFEDIQFGLSREALEEANSSGFCFVLVLGMKPCVCRAAQHSPQTPDVQS